MNMMDEINIRTDDLHWLTKDQAWHYKVLPKGRTAQQFTLYCGDSADGAALIDELEVLLGTPVKLEPINEAQIARLLSKYYLKENGIKGQAAVQSSSNTDDFLISLIGEAKTLKVVIFT